MDALRILDEYLWVFTADERKLLERVSQELAKAGYSRIVQGKMFLYATGKIPVLLVAHGDTVHSKPPTEDEVFCDPRKGVLWSPAGLGADDRAGVLGIVELVRRGYRPHVLVTLGEESGGRGAEEFVEKVKDPGVLYIVELDRKNGNDAVFYGCDNKKFVEYVEEFGFKKADGVFTDISIICPRWNVAGVNLSCGYYNAHSSTEYLVLPLLWDTLERVERMLKNPPRKRFKYEGKAHSLFGIEWKRIFSGKHGSISVYSSYGGYGYDYDCLDYGYYRVGGRSLTRDLSYFDYPIEVNVYLTELVYLYGGTEEQWERFLMSIHDELVQAAEDAVYECIAKEVCSAPVKGAEKEEAEK